MRVRNSFYLLSALGCLAFFSSKGNAMEEDRFCDGMESIKNVEESGFVA